MALPAVAVGFRLRWNATRAPVEPSAEQLTTTTRLVHDPLGKLRADLVRRGYLGGSDLRRTLRDAGMPVAIIGLLGGVRFVAGLVNGNPVVFLGGLLVLMGFAWWRIVTPVRVTPMGWVARERAALGNRHLRPSNSPSYTTYGPEAAAAAVGIGRRPQICGLIARLDGLGFCEVIAESLPAVGRAATVLVPAELESLRGDGTTVVPHGVSLSLGGAEPVDERRIAHLAACADALGAPMVSEHVAFVRASGVEAGHLLPVPRTDAALDALTANTTRTQAGLGVPPAVENIAALFDWPDDRYTEAGFLAELIDRTGVYLLVDIANVYANARNRSRDPMAELSRLPAENRYRGRCRPFRPGHRYPVVAGRAVTAQSITGAAASAPSRLSATGESCRRGGGFPVSSDGSVAFQFDGMGRQQ